MRERWENGVLAVQCGSLNVDLVHRRITVSDVQVHLPPRIFDLLTFFMAEPDQLHTREAIIAEVWAGLVVEEGSLGQSVWLLRKALGAEWRDSIQSVPKRGYVFHPWSQITLITGGASSVEAANPLDPLDIARVEQSDATAMPELAPPDEPPAAALPELAPPGEPPATALPEFAPPGEPPATARALLSMTRVRIGLAACLLLVLIGVGAVAGLRSAGPASPRTVALWVKPTQQGEVRAHHTALLLQDWLRYRLGGSAELLVLTDEDLDEEDAYLPSVTAVISLVPVAADSDVLKARVEVLDGEGSDGPQRIERLISLANFDADMGSLSAQVIALIDSDMQGNHSPRYAIGKARDSYASALDANKRRRFDDALVLFNAALLQAPDFAPLRYRLAHMQANAGEIGVANEQLRTVRALEPNWNPNGLYELELERAHAKTAAELSRVAERYLELYRQHPARLDLFLVGIDTEVSFTERLRLLASVDWTAQPSIISRKAKLLECWALLGIGQPAEAEGCASAVIKRVPASGSVFSMRHLGEAQSILAIARYNQATEDPSFSEFETAAKTYTQVGWGLQALRIRAQAEILSGHPGQQEMPHLAELLALVERNRLLLVELNLFRSLATRLFNLHDAPEALKYLKKTEAAAANYGGRREIVWVSLLLVTEYWNRGELSQVEKRLGELSKLDLDLDSQTEVVAWRAMLMQTRGQQAEALALLAKQLRVIDRPGAVKISEQSATRIRLEAMEIAMERGEFEQVRGSLGVLRADAPEHLVHRAVLFEAQLKLLTGDISGARALILREMPTAGLHFDRDLAFASISVDIGLLQEAQTLANAALKETQVQGYALGSASAMVVLAKIAAAKGNWPEMQRWVQLAKAVAVEPDQAFTAQLELLALVQAASAQGSGAAAIVAGPLLQSALQGCRMQLGTAVAQVYGALGLPVEAQKRCQHSPRNASVGFFWINAALRSRKAV